MKTKYVRKFGAQRLETMCVQLFQPGPPVFRGIDKQHRAVMSQIVR